MQYAIVVEVEQGAETARVCLNYWEPDLTEAAISSVATYLEDTLVALMQY
jgi:hypothetical protein